MADPTPRTFPASFAEALKAYREAHADVSPKLAAWRANPNKRPEDGEKLESVIRLALADLAVTGIEELAKAMSDYRRAEEERTRQVQAWAEKSAKSNESLAVWTKVYAAFTVLIALGTVALAVAAIMSHQPTLPHP